MIYKLLSESKKLSRSNLPPTDDSAMAMMRKTNSIQLREVWAENLEHEFTLIHEIVDDFPFVAMDTEFPDVVCRPIGSFKCTSDNHYATLQTNVGMKFFNSLHGGLNKLAELIDVQRFGVFHHAGFDSLLTSCAFRKFRECYFNGATVKYAGVLYNLGLENGQSS